MSAFAKHRAMLHLFVQLREEHFSVRFGAVYGLHFHLDNREAVEALRRVERDDEDPQVQQAARDVLAGAMT